MDCPDLARELGAGNESIWSRRSRNEDVQKKLILVFIAVLLMLEANSLMAQGPFSILTGKVVGIRGRMWLDVESENDKAIVNFRIGRKTVYVPHRYPNPGEKVKVEYLVQRGTPVAFTVNIIEGSK